MKTIMAVVVMLVAGCTDKAEDAEERCKKACPAYSASFASITPTGSFGNNDYECWCRRGTEAGGGSEPLRIW